MTPNVLAAFEGVAKSIDGFNQAINAWVEDLRKEGESESRIFELTGSAKAMRDSGNIYLAWAHHLASGLPKSEEVGPVTSEQE